MTVHSLLGTAQQISDTIVEILQSQPLLAAPIVLVLAFGESLAFISLVFPFWGILVAIGAVIGFQSSTFVIVWIAASVGAALGDWVSYWIGKTFHDRLEDMWPLSRHPELMPRGRAFFAKYGVWAIVIGRFSGPLRATVPLVAGAVEMKPRTFQLANWSSAFLWAIVLLVFGDAVGRLMSLVWHSVGFASLPVEPTFYLARLTIA
ncbi:MAG: DedA family protein [Hyphomicrobiaceae bacterium]